MLQVIINGVDRSDNIRFDTLIKSDNLNSDEDACDFEFEGAYSDRPQASYELVVNDGVTKIFGGVIVRVDEVEVAHGRLVWSVSAVDYQRLLDRRLVVESYENMTLNEIVEDIVSKYCDGFTTTNVETGPTFTKIQFNYQYVSACFEELAQLAQMHWYVDYDKDIHIFERSTNTAPFEIEEGNGKYDGLKVSPDVTQLKNSVVVRGGTYESDVFYERLKTDGTNRVLGTGYKIRQLVSATLNGDPLTEFGVEYIDDETSKEILINYNEQHVLLGDLIVTVPTAGDNLTLGYRYDTPVVIQKEDDDSIQRMADIEGGDGVYEAVIVDRTITSKEVARQRADAELKEYANPVVRISFKTNESGLRSGQLINVSLPSRGIDGQYLIRSVTMKPRTPDGSLIEYQVETESKLKGVDDLLIELFAISRRVEEIRADEVLDKLKGISDTMVFTDALTVETAAPETRVGFALVGYSQVG